MRVLFDSSDNRNNATQKLAGIVGGPTISTGGIFSSVTPIHSPSGNVPSMAYNIHQFREGSNIPFTPRVPSSPKIMNVKTPGKNSSVTSNNNSSVSVNTMIGDVGEPLWIQLTHPYGTTSISSSGDINMQSHTQSVENRMPSTPRYNYPMNGLEYNKDNNGNSTLNFSTWLEPDEVSLMEAKKVITSDDKKIFWEMTKTIIELPEISEYCNCSLRNANDLTTLLKRPEFRILWTAEAADLLPKHTTSELITAAYMHCPDK